MLGLVRARGRRRVYYQLFLRGGSAGGLPIDVQATATDEQPSEG